MRSPLRRPDHRGNQRLGRRRHVRRTLMVLVVIACSVRACGSCAGDEPGVQPRGRQRVARESGRDGAVPGHPRRGRDDPYGPPSQADDGTIVTSAGSGDQRSSSSSSRTATYCARSCRRPSSTAASPIPTSRRTARRSRTPRNSSATPPALRVDGPDGLPCHVRDVSRRRRPRGTARGTVSAGVDERIRGCSQAMAGPT